MWDALRLMWDALGLDANVRGKNTKEKKKHIKIMSNPGILRVKLKFQS
jgi:hypothetical protein